MSGTTIKQDLPPPGGYKPINYLRVPAKTYFSGVQMFVLFNVVTFGGLYIWSYTHEKLKRLKTEDRASRLALQPMLYAEKDRLYMKRLRKLREEEEELMKDVPGWVVGTYWGEPIYQTRPENEWHEIQVTEYMAHSPHYKQQYINNFFKWL
ncbi:unnamed protein product [Orchesella dallaii]|uniref:NADH dehydrogenase [ubiquinone] 1 alpha subcomplex subunit 13 n=1 Tax=Orchesella dallaii TaxID=48710 RepID=A0ABP1Q7V8_9HEXA